ncbi:MAG: zinc ABC transporter substrate-binding protein, partial [Parasporobacterium sp.]|nr:zinc ABC transporter substrate-binding protein [Parasporobacterium sp.]
AGEVTMLLSPGMESHSYEPTPADIVAIAECDLFLYIGGEDENWVKEILKSMDEPVNALALIDFVDVLEEETKEGMTEPKSEGRGVVADYVDEDDNAAVGEMISQGDGDDTGIVYADADGISSDDESDEIEYDEHIWTSPKNALKMMDAVAEAIAECAGNTGLSYITPEAQYSEDNQESESGASKTVKLSVKKKTEDSGDSAETLAYICRANASDYRAELQALADDYRAFFDNAGDVTLIFGDRFPFAYLAHEYNINYYAAFPGCSEGSEPSAATMAFLIDKTRELKSKAVFYIEFSNHAIADAIAESAGTGTAMLHSCHNVTYDDLNAGESYVSLMRTNLDTLKTVLK